jgi:recombination protein RecT
MSANGQDAKDEPMRALVRRIDSFKPAIQAALPNSITPERFVRVMVTALRCVPQLAECDETSVLVAMMQCAQWGLLPNDGLGKAYLTPRFNGKAGRKECMLILGYKGLRDLAERGSGSGRTLFARVVYEADTFDLSYAPPHVEHKPARDKPGRPIGAYAACYRGGNLEAVRWLSLDEIEESKKRSDSGKKGFGPWATDWDAMAAKTALRRLCTRDLTLSADDPLARAVEIDEANEQGRAPAIDAQVYEVLGVEPPTDEQPEPAQIAASSKPEGMVFGARAKAKAAEAAQEKAAEPKPEPQA